MATARGRAAGALLALAVLVGASCTGDDGGPSPDDTSASTAAAGEVRLALPGGLIVDPAEASLASASDQMVLDLLYEGLMRLDANRVAQPALATEVVPNATFTAWRFALSPDATFSDGSPLTAGDVIASIEHVAEGGDGSLQALALEPIVGFREFVDGKAENIRGLSAPDGQTVAIATTGPLSVLPTLLASPYLGVVKVDALEAVTEPGDLADLPLSGAWQVQEADGDQAVLEPRSAAAAGGVASVSLRAHDDEAAAYEAFADGEADWAVVPVEAFDEAVEEFGSDAFAPFQAELFFGMNLASPNLANAYLRLAIATAIDRDAIIEEVYRDLADPLATIIPAGVRGADPRRCAPCEPDPDVATQLVKTAYPNGKVPEIAIDFDESPAQTQMAELIAEDLEAVGIPTKLNPMPLEEYKRFVVSGDQQLFTFGWIGAFASPDAYLARLFYTSSDDNLTRFTSPKVDAQIRAARATADFAKQQTQWAAAETEILRSAVVVPIGQFRTQVVVSDRVTGWDTAVDGSVDWPAVSVAG